MLNPQLCLIDFSLSKVPEYWKSLDPRMKPFVIMSLRDLLEKRRDYVTTFHLLLQTLGTGVPANILDNIMKVPNDPLPSSDLPPSSSSNNNPNRLKSRPWEDAENLRLLAGIYRYGIKDWGEVAKFIGNDRTTGQCSQRWLRCLDPNIKKEQWSDEEELMLLSLVNFYGTSSWTKVSAKLQNRTDVQCRYRYSILSKTPNFQTLLNKAPVFSPHDSPQQTPLAVRSDFVSIPSLPFLPYPPPQQQYCMMQVAYPPSFPVGSGFVFPHQPQVFPAFYPQSPAFRI
jgi:hypothetical protein